MQKLLLILAVFSFTSLSAQSQSISNDMYDMHRQANGSVYRPGDSISANNKWSLQKYAGISASYSFFKGGNASIISAPVGLQLNRRLNNNLYAFVGISAAPAYVNFSRSFVNTDLKKINSGALHMYSRFEAGLMYINDQKTFSVSGSISVDRGSYPLYPYYNRTGIPTTQSPLNGALK